MRTILHLWTTPPDALTRSLIESQRADPGPGESRIEVIDLSGPERPDYGAILEKIFAAASVSTW